MTTYIIYRERQWRFAHLARKDERGWGVYSAHFEQWLEWDGPVSESELRLLETSSFTEAIVYLIEDCIRRKDEDGVRAWMELL